MSIHDNKDFLSDKLYEALKNTPDQPVEFRESRDNLPVPVLNNNALHSAYYPLREAERISNDQPENHQIICIGFGAGYHLTVLAQQKRDLIIVPLDLQLFKQVLNRIKLTQWFDRTKTKIVLKEEVIKNFDFYKNVRYDFIIHPVMERLFPGDVLEMIKKIGSSLSPALLEMNTQRKFGKIWLKNITKNIKHYFLQDYNFDPLVVKNKCLLITGSGPSLQNHISVIKDHYEDLFIAAADTSLKVLLKHNIHPHAVFSFDAQHITHFLFTDSRPSYRIFTDITTPLFCKKSQTIVFSNHPIKTVFTKANTGPVLLPSDSQNIGGAITDFFAQFCPGTSLLTAGIDYGIHRHYLYSRGTYLDEYKLIHQTYFHGSDTIDAGLLYKHQPVDGKQEWFTTKTMQQYAVHALSGPHVYSLSSSPYIKCRKVKDLKEYINRNKINLTVPFTPPQMTIDQFKTLLLKELKNNPAILDSYFLAINRKPTERLMMQTIEEIERQL